MSVLKPTLIIVLGDGGSGKSSFINDILLGQNPNEKKLALVGHGLQATTLEIKQYYTKINDMPVTILDTPRFDSNLFAKISRKYLDNSSEYRRIYMIFLYNVSRTRIGKDMHTHMILLESALHNQKIIFGTTFWDRLDDDTEGQDREVQLKSRFQIFQSGLVIRVGRDGGSKLLEKLEHPSSLMSEFMLAGQGVEIQSGFDSQDTGQRNKFVANDEISKENKAASHRSRRNKDILKAIISHICQGDLDE